MIDLSPMKGIQVDPQRRTARAQPGLTLGEFDRHTQAHGLATTMGIASEVGIAGVTLGGGYGWLAGRYGLACDNLLSVALVTAEGKHVSASEGENVELFWGVRGGRANFGVITSFEYRLHTVGKVLGGMVLYAPTRDALRFFDEFSSSCPDEVSTRGCLRPPPTETWRSRSSPATAARSTRARRRSRRCATSARRSRTCSNRAITRTCRA